MNGDGTRFTIGQLARRTGFSVRTIRFYSDQGLLPPAERSGAGYRIYDIEALTRLDLIRTLRRLGFDLATIRRVLAQRVGVAEIAAVHADALDAQIRTLTLRRAVLRAVAKRGAGLQGVQLMSKLAHMSDTERRQILHDFLDEVFGGLDVDPQFQQMMRSALPNLPEDPSPEQVEAWVELADLMRDPDFRRRIRAMSEFAARERAVGRPPLDRQTGLAVADKARTALAAGIAPESAAARAVVDEIVALLGGARSRAELIASLRAGTDARAERYWQLLATINGWPRQPDLVPAYEWIIAALEAKR